MFNLDAIDSIILAYDLALKFSSDV